MQKKKKKHTETERHKGNMMKVNKSKREGKQANRF